MPDEDKEIRCFFCDKSQEQVIKVITGEKANICNECVDLCNDIIAEELPDETENEEIVPGDPLFFCSFCTEESPMGRPLAHSRDHNASICEKCILQHFQLIDIVRGPWKSSFFTGGLHFPLEPQSGIRPAMLGIIALTGLGIVIWRLFGGPFGITL